MNRHSEIDHQRQNRLSPAAHRHGGTLAYRAMRLSLRGVGALILLFTAGCSARTRDGVGTQSKERELFLVKARQSPPQPVYNRLYEVRPPDPLPPGGSHDETSPPEPSSPVFRLELSQVPLEEAAKMLAKRLGYRHYCSSFVARRKVSLDAEGTADELVAKLASELGIHGVLDHTNQEVRFLLRGGDRELQQ